uniref:RRM domain-containing protein n=1 Tax=Caenorhabditis japonica TaxID=281687 RepID=A0A8R1DRI4_CAEJA
MITVDPTLEQLGLPAYPPLPVDTDPAKVEEIRRTVYVGNLPKGIDGKEVLDLFNMYFGEVMYVRMASGPDALPCSYAYVEFSQQASVSNALQNDGFEFKERPLKIQHSRVAIIKPQAKTDEQALGEIEEAIRLGKTADDRDRDRDRRRSRSPRRRRSPSPRRRSRSRRRDSRDRDRKRSRDRRSKSRDRDRKRSRSRDRKRRSRSRERDRDTKKRSRSRERDRDRDRDRRRRSKSRDRKRDRSRSKSKDRKREKRRSRSRSPEKKRDKEERKSEKKENTNETNLREKLLEKKAARKDSSDSEWEEKQTANGTDSLMQGDNLGNGNSNKKNVSESE